jgi:hypothetical protein
MIDFNKYFIVGTNSYALHDTMNGLVIGELIHCKDCKWYRRDHNGGCLCETGGGLYNSRPEDYCSRAERRNDERME